LGVTGSTLELTRPTTPPSKTSEKVVAIVLRMMVVFWFMSFVLSSRWMSIDWCMVLT